MECSQTEIGSRLYALLDETTNRHQPFMITGKRGNAVLLAGDDWKAINETLHFQSVPGTRESIQGGMAAKLDDCDQELDC